MSTAVEPAEQIDPPYKPPGEDDEEEESHPNEFKWYIRPEPAYAILQKRWGLFTILSAIPYFYHFISVILGID